MRYSALLPIAAALSTLANASALAFLSEVRRIEVASLIGLKRFADPTRLLTPTASDHRRKRTARDLGGSC